MLKKIEMETIILFNEAEDRVEVTTYNLASIHRLEKLAASHPDEVSLIRNDGRFAEYHFPKKWVKIMPPPNQTAEERERKRNQMKALRAPITPSAPVDDLGVADIHHSVGDSSIQTTTCLDGRSSMGQNSTHGSIED